MTAGTKKPRIRNRADYERPTDEKINTGARMLNARRTTTLSLDDMAKLIGYSQPGKLSLMENGKRPATTQVLVAYAKHCGTTMDYLCGLSDDIDRDPAIAMQRYVTNRISADVGDLVRTIVGFHSRSASMLLPGQHEGARMSMAVMELTRAVQNMRTLNDEFDEMRGGATVLSKCDVLHRMASDYAAAVDRARRLLKVRSSNDDGGPQQSIDLLPLEDDD